MTIECVCGSTIRRVAVRRDGDEWEVRGYTDGYPVLSVRFDSRRDAVQFGREWLAS